MGFKSFYVPWEAEPYIEVKYTVTSRNGQQMNYAYRIDVIEVPSNLELAMCFILSALKPEGSAESFTWLMTIQNSNQDKPVGRGYIMIARTLQKMGKYNNNYWRLENHI